MGARGLAQRGGLGARHQHQPGVGRVGQGLHGGLVAITLFFQPGQGAQARGIALARFQETAPGAGQLQQADGVAGGRRVEQDVLVLRVQGRVGQQRGEFVESGNLGGAGARELFLDALDHRIGQHAAHRANDAVTVALGGGLRVDLQRRQARHTGHGRDVVANRDTEHLPHVGGRVGAHQQHAPALRRQLQRGGAGERGLAHAAFAGEEKKAWRLIKKMHVGMA